MSNLVQVEQTNLLNASLIPGSFVATTAPLMLRLMTGTVPTTTTAGTQVTGGSYAPQNLTTALGTAASGALTNTSALNFTSMPSCTLTALEVWDSAGTPVRKWFASITSKVVNSGDTVTVAASALNFSMTT